MFYGDLFSRQSVVAVVKSLFQHSQSLDSTYDVSVEEARVVDIAVELVWGKFVQGAVESEYGHYVRPMKIVRRFPEALLLVKKLEDKAARESSSATTGVLGATHLKRAVLSSADDHDVLL